MTNIQLKHSFYLLLTAAIWGVSFVAQSVGMEYVGPFTFNGVRSLIGAAFLVPCILFLFWRNKIKNSSQENFQSNAKNSSRNSIPARERNCQNSSSAHDRTLLLGGICCGLILAAASSLQQIGIQYTAVGKAGFLTAVYIVLVPVLGLFLKKRCSPLVWISVILAFAGLYLLTAADGFSSIESGDLMLLAGAFLFAIHILVIDYFSPRCDGVKMSCIQFLVCGILCTAIALITEHPQISAILTAAVPILYAGILSCGIAYTLQIIGQKSMNPTVASLILSLESAISVLAGWLILGQKLSFREILGCVIVFAAIILAQLPMPSKGKSEHTN